MSILKKVAWALGSLFLVIAVTTIGLSLVVLKKSACPPGVIGELLAEGHLMMSDVVCRSGGHLLVDGRDVEVVSVYYGRVASDDIIGSNQMSVIVDGTSVRQVPYFLSNLNNLLLTVTAQRVHVVMGTSTPHKPFVHLNGLVYGPNDKGEYCGDFEVEPPMKGNIEACTSTGTGHDSVLLQGDITPL